MWLLGRRGVGRGCVESLMFCLRSSRNPRGWDLFCQSCTWAAQAGRARRVVMPAWPEREHYTMHRHTKHALQKQWQQAGFWGTCTDRHRWEREQKQKSPGPASSTSTISRSYPWTWNPQIRGLAKGLEHPRILVSGVLEPIPRQYRMTTVLRRSTR